MNPEKTRARIAQDATEHPAPYVGSPHSGATGGDRMSLHTCQNCGGNISAGGIYYAGNTIEARQVTDIGHVGGRYCAKCADTVAFWLVIDGDYDMGAECEGCGVIVMAADACYCMAAVSCPACFAATFDTDLTTTTPKEGGI